ncbi:PGF-CTERM-anchored ABC transporter substrate-binding protein [Halosimplex aquaticum]|uniref:PGF-CTERM-anchored ABC transporter substrate-binding protein n=1 Tax=Halosimplex aquaticum TaxID=3026162 RepID=A0ABD5Y7C1_9EURY|nr:PGF-CTERM-anchored ABC transporter substrate-binding protein [Halosimplex aquaticum]
MRDATAVVGAALVLVAAFGAVATPAAAGVGAGSGAASASASGLADSHCTYPMTVTDASGTEVTIEEDPDRLVALAPSAAQILWDIGAHDEVVGLPINQYTSYLDGREGKTDVATNDSTVINEAVVGAEPDLVLAPNVISNETVQTLRDSGLTVYRFEEADNLEDVYAKIELYGQLTGNYEEAGRTSARMQGQVQAVRDAVSDEENPRVYFSLGGGWTAGENTFVGRLIEAAGGNNIAAGEINTSNGYGQLSDEIVAQKDPEWIVQNGQFGTVPKTAAFNQSTAVQEGNIVQVNRNFMTQNGPRNVQPLKKMAQAFHPEAYENVDFSAVETPQPVSCPTSTATTAEPTETATAESGDATPTATAETGATPTDTETPVAETTSDGGPGFTAATALVALLAGALFARRRR